MKNTSDTGLSNPRHLRRGHGQKAVLAHLVLDNRLKGTIGIASLDLIEDLVPSPKSEFGPGQASTSLGSPRSPLHFLALKPQTNVYQKSLAHLPWTVFVVRAERATDGTQHSTIRAPSSSPSIQALLDSTHPLASIQAFPHDSSRFEVRVVHTVPIPLETVYVFLDTKGLQRLDAARAVLGEKSRQKSHELPLAKGSSKSKQSSSQNGDVSSESTRNTPGDFENGNTIPDGQLKPWIQALCQALRKCAVVHARSLLPLPLPPHPITYTPAPPARICFCEPACQGIVSVETRVVIIKTPWVQTSIPASVESTQQFEIKSVYTTKPESQESRKSHSPLGRNQANGVYGGGVENSVQAASESVDGALQSDKSYPENPLSNSSIEDEEKSQRSAARDGEGSLFSSFHFDDVDEAYYGLDTLSDDSEDTIQLSFPSLPPAHGSEVNGEHPSTSKNSAESGRGSFNPALGPELCRNIPDRPSSSSNPADCPSGKVFLCRGLLENIPDEILCPKLLPLSDNNHRVFVETKYLVRIGCFAGNWVRIAVPNMEPESPPSIPNGERNREDHRPNDACNWRVARIYDPRYLLVSPLENTRKQGQYAPSLHKHAMVKASLTFNDVVGGNRNVMDPLENPPVAREVKLSRVASPLSTERALQPAIYAGLKAYFETRQRIVRSGDLIAVTFDHDLAKATAPKVGMVIQPGAGPNSKESVEAFDPEVAALDEFISISSLEDGGNAVDNCWGPEETLDAINGSIMKRKNIAWFRVDSVVLPDGGEDAKEINGELSSYSEPWAGTAVVDANNTKMSQSGVEHTRIPPAGAQVGACFREFRSSSTWPYYYGLKPVPPLRLSSSPSSSPSISSQFSSGSRSEPGPVLDSTRWGQNGGENNGIYPVLATMDECSRLVTLFEAATSQEAVMLDTMPLAVLLSSSHRSTGKSYIVAKAAASLGLHLFEMNAWDLLAETDSSRAGQLSSGRSIGAGWDVKSDGTLRARVARAAQCGAFSTVLLIKRIEALSAQRMELALRDVIAHSGLRVIVATTSEVDKVPDGIRGLFPQEIEMKVPDQNKREAILREIIENKSLLCESDLDLAEIAAKTASFEAGDLVDVVDRSVVARKARIQSIARAASQTLKEEFGGRFPLLRRKDRNSDGINNKKEEGDDLDDNVNDNDDDDDDFSDRYTVLVADVVMTGGEAVVSITKKDFVWAVDEARRDFSLTIGAPNIPKVFWEDVGGLSYVKSAVAETIELPMFRPELFSRGMKKRSGILFYGPPGTGKTLLAKAIATEYSLNFFSVKGPELLNSYIGESEANVRRVFQRARDARPCVVFFDELDSVAPKRGNQNDSGGVMDRIVSQLLAELDGMSDGDDPNAATAGGVFVIAATNRPDLLDPALLRPGRFDKLIYLGINDTHEKQEMVLRALTRRFTLDKSVSLERVSRGLPLTYTGADLYALCSDAILKAITRQARRVDERVEELRQIRGKKGEDEIPGVPDAGAAEVLTTARFLEHYATEEDLNVLVTEQDFIQAQAELVPSVTPEEMLHYDQVRRNFQGSSAPFS